MLYSTSFVQKPNGCSFDIPAMKAQLPDCPPPGSGVNRWLLTAANHLRGMRVSEVDAGVILRRLMTRPESGSEVGRALSKAYSAVASSNVWLKGGKPTKLRLDDQLNPRRQAPDHRAIEKAVAIGFTHPDLRAVSPINFELRSDSWGIIEALFPQDAFICCSRNKEWGAETRLISEFGDEFDKFSFIVPQTMTKRSGLTSDLPPKAGPRTLDNTGPWRFFVYESDFLSLDHQAAVIYQLASIRPLALAVFSGSKSIHAYFYVGTLSERELQEFQCLAIRLGGCTGPLNRCQLVRMPNGFNHQTKRSQEVLYFDPNVIL